MTTICSDGKTVAADGLVCSEDEPINWDEKKLFLRNGVLCAFLGEIRFWDAAWRWFESGMSLVQHPATEKFVWQMLIFHPTEVLSFNHQTPYPASFPYPCAFGAGEQYAMAALLCGKTSEEAIKITSKLNLRTGGTITVMPVPRKEIAEAAE